MVKVILIGNLTANPESRAVNTAKGVNTVCNFTVAANRIVNGEQKAYYFRVSCWGKQAENAMKYLSKGSKVAVTSDNVTATAYTTRNGTVQAAIEMIASQIEYLSKRSDSPDNAMEQQPPAVPYDGSGFMEMPEGIDEEIPFA